MVGLPKARELVYTGRHVDASEALEIGLVDRVADGNDVHALALEHATAFANGPTLAYAAAKRALAASHGLLEEGLAVEREAFAPLFATRDQKEGMRAFLDKREPEFEGR